MRIIPAIDIIDGKCVRLSRGKYDSSKVYSKNPLDVAKAFEDAGLEYLHLVDLDGARSQHIVNYKVLETICSKTGLKVDFGGGLKTAGDLKIAFECGAIQVSGGSIAVKDPVTFKEWLKTYGSDKIILGADSINRKIASSGWMEESSTDVLDFIKQYEREGISYVICTDIARDGMLEGTSNELYREILGETKVRLIASGGVSGLDDLIVLKEMGCEGAIVGKAYYEGKITLKQMQELC